jgi:hypothetical protein
MQKNDIRTAKVDIATVSIRPPGQGSAGEKADMGGGRGSDRTNCLIFNRNHSKSSDYLVL